jgi:hypothetical protein
MLNFVSFKEFNFIHSEAQEFPIMVLIIKTPNNFANVKSKLSETFKKSFAFSGIT